jgi:hypothetical protein
LREPDRILKSNMRTQVTHDFHKSSTVVYDF